MTKFPTTSTARALPMRAFICASVTPVRRIQGARNSGGEYHNQPSTPFATVAATSARKLIGNDCTEGRLRGGGGDSAGTVITYRSAWSRASIAAEAAARRSISPYIQRASSFARAKTRPPCYAAFRSPERWRVERRLPNCESGARQPPDELGSP